MKNESWIVRVQVRGLQPVWAGDFDVIGGRAEAKVAAMRFVSKHFPLDITTILNIARGTIEVTFRSEPEPFNDLPQS